MVSQVVGGGGEGERDQTTEQMVMETTGPEAASIVCLFFKFILFSRMETRGGGEKILGS